VIHKNLPTDISLVDSRVARATTLLHRHCFYYFPT